MPGKGRDQGGNTGCSPKSDEHREAIAESLRAYWKTDEGKAVLARRRQEWREYRLARRKGEVE